jgi:osmotically-inducible protein OsmY
MRLLKVAILLICVLASALAAVAQEPSDSQLATTLRQRIEAGTQVSVQVNAGIVTLTGTVSNYSQKLGAINITRRMIGVKGVVDHITVVPAAKRTDDDIVRAVRATLVDNLSPSEFAAIAIGASNGVVTLAGTLPNSYPKQIAGELAGWVPGVVDVRNNIVVRPSQVRSDPDIQQDVNARFGRNPFIPASAIHVTVDRGVVTLTGTVDSFLQAEQAESVARFTPGVVDVQNNLFVRATGRRR